MFQGGAASALHTVDPSGQLAHGRQSYGEKVAIVNELDQGLPKVWRQQNLPTVGSFLSFGFFPSPTELGSGEDR